MAHLGRSGITALVARAVALARTLAAMVDRADDLERLAPAVTSIVAFRYRPAGRDDAWLDAINHAIPPPVRRRGPAFPARPRPARPAAPPPLPPPPRPPPDTPPLLPP